MNDILCCKECRRNTHRISCLSSNNLLNSFSLSCRSPPCHCDMLNSLSYLFVHSFCAQCVLLKGCAGQQGQKLLLCFVLDFAPSEGRGRCFVVGFFVAWVFCVFFFSLRASLEALLGKPLASGGRSRQAACSWRSSRRESREHRHGGDGKETF